MVVYVSDFAASGAGKRRGCTQQPCDFSGVLTDNFALPQVFACPSRGLRTWIRNSTGDGFDCGDYAAVGFQPGWVPLPDGHVRADSTDFKDEESWRGAIVPHSVPYDSNNASTTDKDRMKVFGKVGFGEITDGSSNTMLFGEKSAWTQTYQGSFDQFFLLRDDEWGKLGQGGRFGAMRNPYWFNIPDNEVVTYRTNVQNGNFHNSEALFGSPHPGTFNVVLGDGSVKAISMNTDAATMWSLAMRDDGAPLDHNNF